jgi:hypothetical protein
MGYWENTTYIATRATDKIARAMIELFESEGMKNAPRPLKRERSVYEPMQYETSRINNLWGVALFSGAGDWSVIKTAPLELLGEKSLGRERIRLVELCEKLRCGGFQLNVYDDSGAILLETDGSGHWTISGHNPCASDDVSLFHGTTLQLEERWELQFDLLPLAAGDDYQKLAESFAQELGGDNARFCDNLTSVGTLVCHKPLEALDGIDLYFQWPTKDRNEPPPGTWDEYKAWRNRAGQPPR